MASRKTEVVAEPGHTTIVIRRTFDAPARLVFEAWTKPEHVRHWGSVSGWTMTVCEIDLRPGGSWRYVLHCDGVGEAAFFGVYREVVPPRRLVHTEAIDVPEFRDRPAVVTTLFEEHDGTTTVTATMVYQTVADRDASLQSGMEEGGVEAHGRIDDLLAAMS